MFFFIGEPILCFECGEKIAIESKEGTCIDCTKDEGCYCAVCNTEQDIENLYFLEAEGRYICPDCLEKFYVYCEGCGEYINKDNIHIYNNKNLPLSFCRDIMINAIKYYIECIKDWDND